MLTITKTLVGTVAAGAMAMAPAAPASAQTRYDGRDRSRDRGGIDAGDVIAGALIIGGLAAVAGSVGRNNNGYVYQGNPYNRGYDNRGGYYNYDQYDRAGDPRQAVEQCVSAASQGASRYSYGGRANVTDIRKIDRKRDGFVVKGRIAVNTRSQNWRGGWGNDYRGFDDRYNGYDSGSFTCRVQYGRIVDLDYSGIRGL
ncbi:MAG: hypothetical protein ABIT09_13300 [Croceibacterium sp.]